MFPLNSRYLPPHHYAMARYMYEAPDSRSKMRLGGRIWIIFLISGFSLVVGLLSSYTFGQLDSRVTDLWMQLRYELKPPSVVHARSDITILAVDYKTLRIKGLYGRGEWMARQPFLDQIHLFSQYYTPSVLAYDFLLQDERGDSGREADAALRSKTVVQPILDQLVDFAQTGEPFGTGPLLSMINISTAQGNTRLMAALAASSTRSNAFPTVLAYNFRFGELAPAVHASVVVPWSDEDVYGGPDGKWGGTRIPYINGLTIPESSLHFPENFSYDYHQNANTPMGKLLDYAELAYINVPRDEDGTVRRVPLIAGYTYTDRRVGSVSNKWVASYAFTSVLYHLGVPLPLDAAGVEPGVEVFFGDKIIVRPPGKSAIHIPIDERGAMYLNCNAQFSDFQAVSFADVAPDYRTTTMAERLEIVRDKVPNVFDGHLVMVAPVATSIGDIGPSPLDPHVPFVYIHAMAANNILEGNFLRVLAGPERLRVMLFLALLLPALAGVFRRSGFVLVSGVMLVVYLAVSFGLIALNSYVLPIVGPVVFLIVGGFLILGYRFLVVDRSRREIRKMFSTMVSARVLERMEAEPDAVSLGGKEVEATVFFSDIRGFTSITEALSSARQVELTNSYMTAMTRTIMDSDGYVDKFLGDGVMAVWGAPFPDSEHAEKACRAALRQQETIRELHDQWLEEFGVDIQVRMGVNTGRVTAGNMGSAEKFEYTVMGDVVNVAARLEPSNKDYGTRIIIGEPTRAELPDDLFVRPLDVILVQGKTQPVQIFELVGLRAEIDPVFIELCGLYASALDAYVKREWSTARCRLETALGLDPEDGPSIFLLQRVERYSIEPPNDEWCGEYVRLRKD